MIYFLPWFLCLVFHWNCCCCWMHVWNDSVNAILHIAFACATAIKISQNVLLKHWLTFCSVHTELCPVWLWMDFNLNFILFTHLSPSLPLACVLTLFGWIRRDFSSLFLAGHLILWCIFFLSHMNSIKL